MNIRNVAIKDLKPFDKNAKKHPKEQIDHVANSIKEFGIVQPIVCDKNNIVVIGHCRLMACKKLNKKEVPVLYVEDLTDQQVAALRLADNKTNESEWDLNLLDESMAEIFDIDMSSFGFDDFNIKDEVPEVFEDEPPHVDLDNKPIAKMGDVWRLGCHKLMCGDSTSVESVSILMDGVKSDMLLTDPPYNVSYEGKTKDALTIENDSMDNDSFREFLKDAFTAANSALKEGGVFYIWHADLEGYNFRGACFDVGWKIRQCLIWVKNSIVMGRQDYHWKHEPCLYGWKDGAVHFWNSDRKQRTAITNVDLYELKKMKKDEILKIVDEHNLIHTDSTIIYEDKPARNAEHPTMKPIRLLSLQIKNNTEKNDIVFDPFGGSGSTLIACEQLGRTCYMMELDPKYVDVIIKRWENLTGKKAVLCENK